MPSPLSVRGLSVWQLLVAVAIAAVITASALPSFGYTSLKARGVASVNLLLGSLHFARSAAVLQALPTVVCLSADGRRCVESPGVEARGWLVFHDVARGPGVQIDSDDTILRAIELPARVSVRGTRSAVTYWPVARAGTTATFLICHDGHPKHGRAVIVSQTGRPRTASDGQWTDQIRCP